MVLVSLDLISVFFFRYMSDRKLNLFDVHYASWNNSTQSTSTVWPVFVNGMRATLHFEHMVEIPGTGSVIFYILFHPFIASNMTFPMINKY